MADDTLRGAIIGLGNVAINGHVPGWRARRDAAIVAATDLRPAQSDVLKEHLPDAVWYDTSDALYAAEDLDFVDICTPPAQHADDIRTALDHGLHVLCEKPLVSAIDQLAPIAAHAAQQKCIVHTVHNWLQAPPVRKITELVDNGTIGTVTDCRWQTIRNKPAAAATSDTENWRTDPKLAGGGILVDHGWHALYIVLRWMRQTPLSVNAVLENRKFKDLPIEDTAMVRLTFPDGSAEIELTWAGEGRGNQVELNGDGGRISLDDGIVVWQGSGTTAPDGRWQADEGLSQGSHHPDWFGGVVDEFIAGIKDAEGMEAGAPGNLADASLCARLIDLAKTSSRRGGATETV